MHIHYSISLYAMQTDAQIRNVIENIQQNADILNVSRKYYRLQLATRNRMERKCVTRPYPKPDKYTRSDPSLFFQDSIPSRTQTVVKVVTARILSNHFCDDSCKEFLRKSVDTF
jgi:hypothetical protein